MLNGLKREELIASNSMILHEVFFASLGDESAPAGELRDALTRNFGRASIAGGPNSRRWGRRKAADRDGCC